MIDPAQLATLRPREQEVLAGVVHGLTLKEIASVLYISPASVKNDLYHARIRLGMRRSSRTKLVVALIRAGQAPWREIAQ